MDTERIFSLVSLGAEEDNEEEHEYPLVTFVIDILFKDNGVSDYIEVKTYDIRHLISCLMEAFTTPLLVIYSDKKSKGRIHGYSDKGPVYLIPTGVSNILQMRVCLAEDKYNRESQLSFKED